MTLTWSKPSQQGAAPENVTCTGTPPMVTTGVADKFNPVANSARNVGEFAVRVLKSPSRNVTALRMAPSRVPVPNNEKSPAGALVLTVIVPFCVPLDDVTTTGSEPSGVFGSTTALI